MSLKQQIDNDIKKAMLAKEKDALRRLRALKCAILLAERTADLTALNDYISISWRWKALELFEIYAFRLKILYSINQY